MAPAAAGKPGYPALAAGDWIWGGTLEDIQQTITYGIRSGDDDARDQPDAALRRRRHAEAGGDPAVADYVDDAVRRRAARARTSAEGKQLFAENCARLSRRGGAGQSREGRRRGWRRRSHLRGDDRAAVVAQITNPRMGVMPNWNTRLDEAKIKSLALYVHSLGGGE